MATARDDDLVGKHDEEKLRRFVVARDTGDEVAARRWWDELTGDNYDRVAAMVAMRARAHKFSDTEREDALTRAIVKMLNNMFTTFRGKTMGEWVNATKRCVEYACMDTQRAAARVSKHERPLDTATGDDPVHYDDDVYKTIEERRRDEDERAEDLREGRDFLGWALPRLTERERSVLELDLDDVTVEEMQRRLGVSADVIYQARRRYTTHLHTLKSEYEA